MHLLSEEATILQVLLDDDVSDSIKNKLDILCIGGTGHV